MSNGKVFDLGLGKTTPFQPRPLSSYSSPYTYTNNDFVGPPEPGGESMFATAVPLIAQGLGGLFGWFGGKRQDEADRRQMEQQQRQFDQMFAFQQAVR